MAYNPGPYQSQQYGHDVSPQGNQYPQHGGQFPPQQYHSAPPLQSGDWITSDDGIQYCIANRDANTVLNIRLPPGGVMKSKPGAMFQMSPTITLQGKVKLSFTKMLAGGQMAESTYTGPGDVSLAPRLLGDVVAIPINSEGWMLGRDAFLACTGGVSKQQKTQGLGNAFFSGEGLFVYHISGRGTLWATSYGGIMVKELQPNEQHIVDNGHLVAWNCRYSVERAGKGALSSMTTGEGVVCRFTGPGKIYIQTRNLDEFADWVRSVVPRQG